jgi:hypothetical protein
MAQPRATVQQMDNSSFSQLLNSRLLAATGNTATLTPLPSSGFPGMTSLYGKLRTQAVNPAAVASTMCGDAQADAAPSACLSAGSSSGTAHYGMKFAASAISSDAASSILQPHGVFGSAPLQYSLFSANSATSSTTTSSMRSHSTTSSVGAAPHISTTFQAPLPSGTTPEAPVATPSDFKALGTFGLASNLDAAASASGRLPDSANATQDQQALISLLQTAVGPAPSTAQASTAATQALLSASNPSSSTLDSNLLEQLQQLYVNESTAASRSYDDSSAGSQGFNGMMQQQLLMKQLQDLQAAQCRQASTASAGSSTGIANAAAGSAAPLPLLSDLYGGCAAAAPDPAYGLNSNHAAVLQQFPGLPPLTPASMVPNTLTPQQAEDTNWALAQLLAQLGPDAGMASTNSTSLAAFSGQLPGPAGLTMPTGAAATAGPSSAVVAALEGLKHRLLTGSAGMMPAGAAPGAGSSGIMSNLAGLAAAATAAVGGWAGLLPAGKHRLQVGPGSNPMYKVGRCTVCMLSGCHAGRTSFLLHILSRTCICGVLGCFMQWNCNMSNTLAPALRVAQADVLCCTQIDSCHQCCMQICSR